MSILPYPVKFIIALISMFVISLPIPIVIALITMPEDPDMEELERELSQLVVSGNKHYQYIHSARQQGDVHVYILDERQASREATLQTEMLPTVPTTLPVLEEKQPHLDSQHAPHGTPTNRPIRHQERVAELT
jgi:hypothetical protein